MDAKQETQVKIILLIGYINLTPGLYSNISGSLEA